MNSRIPGSKSEQVSEERAKALSKEEALRLVAQALDEVQFGEVTIKIQSGKPVWVDKFERERVG